MVLTVSDISDRSGDVSRAIPIFSSSLEYYVGKTVKVQVERNFHVEGKLLSFQENSRLPHRPSLMVLENSTGTHVLRGSFFKIVEVK